jgi:hypothetical protein
MTVVYSIAAINYRLEGVRDAIDSGGANASMELREGTTILSTISLARPCATIDNGELTFSGTLLDPSAAATGNADNVVVRTSAGTLMISGLTVGIPLSGADVILFNGLNSTLVTAGQVVTVLAAQITGH